MTTEKSIIDIETILKLPVDELNNLIKKIQNKTKEEKEKEIRTITSEHAKIVGKCFKSRIKPYSEIFPEMWRYYKIISVRAENEYHVSVLRFDEYPTYWFNYYSSRAGRAGDYYFGYYDFKGITVEELPFCWFDLAFRKDIVTDSSCLTEIDLKEYNLAMSLYIDRLQKMEWPADHHRCGNRKPGDPDWERKINGL